MRILHASICIAIFITTTVSGYHRSREEFDDDLLEELLSQDIESDDIVRYYEGIEDATTDYEKYYGGNEEGNEIFSDDDEDPEEEDGAQNFDRILNDDANRHGPKGNPEEREQEKKLDKHIKNQAENKTGKTNDTNANYNIHNEAPEKKNQSEMMVRKNRNESKIDVHRRDEQIKKANTKKKNHSAKDTKIKEKSNNEGEEKENHRRKDIPPIVIEEFKDNKHLDTDNKNHQHLQPSNDNLPKEEEHQVHVGKENREENDLSFHQRMSTQYYARRNRYRKRRIRRPLFIGRIRIPCRNICIYFIRTRDGKKRRICRCRIGP